MSEKFNVYELEDDEHLKQLGGVWDPFFRRWTFTSGIEKILEYLDSLNSSDSEESSECISSDEEEIVKSTIKHERGFHRERSFNSQCSL